MVKHTIYKVTRTKVETIAVRIEGTCNEEDAREAAMEVTDIHLPDNVEIKLISEEATEEEWDNLIGICDHINDWSEEDKDHA